MPLGQTDLYENFFALSLSSDRDIKQNLVEQKLHELFVDEALLSLMLLAHFSNEDSQSLVIWERRGTMSR